MSIQSTFSQLSGHKNMESLKPYHTASSSQQQQMSDIVNSARSQVLKPVINHHNISSSTTTSMSLKRSHTEQIESVFCGANISNWFKLRF